MTENINSLEKKESTTSELDWKEYDDDEDEEEDKNEISQEKDKDAYSKKPSESHEESSYNNSYYSKRGTKDYSYSSNTYGHKKNYSYYSSKGYGYKKYGKGSKVFNKGYDNGYDKSYDNNYYNSNTHYKKWQNNDSSYYNKYKDRDNYYEHKKMIEKELEYDNKKEEEDKKEEKKEENENNENNENNEITIDFNKKIDRKNFTSGNNKYYNSNKKYGFNRQYNKNNSGFNSREYNDDKKSENKSNRFRRFKEEELPDKKEEDIKKPLFYNSKIPGTQDIPVQNQFIKIEDFINVENLKEDINQIVKDTYLELKAEINKDLEEQYGSLNINAKTYVPKKKILNNNYGQNFINNNNSNIFPQNTVPPSY